MQKILYHYLKTIYFLLCEIFGLNLILRFINKGKIKVLLYHSISDRTDLFDNAVSSFEFKRHIKYLKKY